MRKLLWVGDAGCPSGFARATHEILDVLRRSWDVTVLGLNYRGDPHTYPYPIYAAAPGGDTFGIGRLPWMCATVQPDLVILQNDPWNIPLYLRQLKKYEEFQRIPVAAAVAVDGKNCQGVGLNGLAHAIFWTQFGLEEARLGGYTGPASVIPLGVDTLNYFPMDKYEARSRKLPRQFDDMFIVGNVNRNQPRKRWDLTIRYFAEWVKNFDAHDAYLYMHCAPTGDTGVDVEQLARYYGIAERVILMQPPTFYGLSEADMRDTYNCFDVQLTTTQGEGFGLTTFEGMACGVPQIVPDWASLGELCEDAAVRVLCTSTAIGPPYVNVLGGVADEELTIKALDVLYRDEKLRLTMAERGRTLAHRPCYRWPQIGSAWTETLESVVPAANREAVMA